MDEADAIKKVLALVVTLHRDDRQPWPPRRQVSELTGVPLAMIDEIMTHLQETGQITVWTVTVSGNVKKHDPMDGQRFIQPSDDVLATHA